MAYRGKGNPAPRNHHRWCYPDLIWQLDADLATHPFYFLMISAPLYFHFPSSTATWRIVRKRPCSIVIIPHSLLCQYDIDAPNHYYSMTPRVWPRAQALQSHVIYIETTKNT